VLILQPITYKEACIFIENYHRHHQPPQGWKFGIAANNGEDIVGVITVGRPIARNLDNGMTLEVTRCCTDGTKNACSFLYGAAWRAGKALGYKRMITYTLNSESGSSLKGSGWIITAETQGKRSWNTPARKRIDAPTQQMKLRWEPKPTDD